MSEVGFILGKFMPPHKGHELLIDFGAQSCDTLFVMVSGKEDDVIPVGDRAQWLQDHYDNTPYDVRVVVDYDNIELGEVDEYGTCIDDDFWEAWRNKITLAYPQINRVFTSDRYGERLAKELGAEWIPCDFDREATYGLSATDIRENPHGRFNDLMDEAKDYYRKSVVFVGPESTGKSTTAKEMARVYHTVWVPEYGRTYAASKNNDLTPDDFDIIAEGQWTMADILSRRASDIVFHDSEAMTTYLYGKEYTGEKMKHIRDLAINQDFDLYILMAPTVSWVDDGTRVMPNDKKRWKFYNKMKEFLDKHNKNYRIVDATNYAGRDLQVMDIIDEFVKEFS